MIIYPNKSFVTRDGMSNVNFADESYRDKVFVLDDNSEAGAKILQGFPFEVNICDGRVVDVTIIERLPELLQLPSPDERLEAVEMALLDLAGI